MGDVAESIGDFLNDAFTTATLGTVDLKKGRVYVPFSGASARAGAKAFAGMSSDIFYGVQGKSSQGARRTANAAIDSPAGRLAGSAAAIASGAAVGGVAAPFAGASAATGATLGGIAASSIAQAEALNQRAPELKAYAPLSENSTAVQRAVAEAASRRSRARGFRSTILSQTFLSPKTNLKQTYGS